MAKIYEILNNFKKEKITLFHPIIGYVNWQNLENSGFALYFAKGIECGRYLNVDESVLFDDNWKISNELLEIIKFQIWIIYKNKPIFIDCCYGKNFEIACVNYFKLMSPILYNWVNKEFLDSKIFSSEDQANQFLLKEKK